MCLCFPLESQNKHGNITLIQDNTKNMKRTQTTKTWVGRRMLHPSHLLIFVFCCVLRLLHILNHFCASHWGPQKTHAETAANMTTSKTLRTTHKNVNTTYSEEGQGFCTLRPLQTMFRKHKTLRKAQHILKRPRDAVSLGLLRTVEKTQQDYGRRKNIRKSSKA